MGELNKFVGAKAYVLKMHEAKVRSEMIRLELKLMGKEYDALKSGNHGVSKKYDEYYHRNLESLQNELVEAANIRMDRTEFLRNLSAENEMILRLKYDEGKSTKEICKILNVSHSTFFRKLNDALQQLDYYLERDD